MPVRAVTHGALICTYFIRVSALEKYAKTRGRRVHGTDSALVLAPKACAGAASFDPEVANARSSIRGDPAVRLRELSGLRRRLREVVMETLVVAGIAAALLGYLFFSLIRPERF
jgi:K+-transporting ATPase KdpF subunit